MRFFQRISEFMQGRYGMDALNIFLLSVAGILWLVNIFVWAWIPSMILYALEAGLVALAIVRMLSRNINMRSLENRRFRTVFDPVKNWLTLQIKKFKERKEYKYIKCPTCKAQLRVRNVKGPHGVRCPKCRTEFKVTI